MPTGGQPLCALRKAWLPVPSAKALAAMPLRWSPQCPLPPAPPTVSCTAVCAGREVVSDGAGDKCAPGTQQAMRSTGQKGLLGDLSVIECVVHLQADGEVFSHASMRAQLQSQGRDSQVRLPLLKAPPHQPVLHEDSRMRCRTMQTHSRVAN